MRIAIALLLPLFAAWAQSDDDLKMKIQDRAPAVKGLIVAGSARETEAGYLESAGGTAPDARQIVDEENADRRLAFERIAKASNLALEQVATMFAARAKLAAAKWHDPPGNGATCGAPAKDADVARLLVYVKQGMNLARAEKFEEALAEFKPALEIDRNFLSLNQNIGSMRMKLKQYKEALESFEAESKLVECLAGLAPAALGQYAYFIEGADRAKALAEQIPKARAEVHYNIASLHSVRKNNDAAIEALRKSAKAGFAGAKLLAEDPDLAFVRTDPAFREIAAEVQKNSVLKDRDNKR